MEKHQKYLREAVVYSFLVSVVILSAGFIQRQFKSGVLLSYLDSSSQSAAAAAATPPNMVPAIPHYSCSSGSAPWFRGTTPTDYLCYGGNTTTMFPANVYYTCPVGDTLVYTSSSYNCSVPQPAPTTWQIGGSIYHNWYYVYPVYNWSTGPITSTYAVISAGAVNKTIDYSITTYSGTPQHLTFDWALMNQYESQNSYGYWSCCSMNSSLGLYVDNVKVASLTTDTEDTYQNTSDPSFVRIGPPSRLLNGSTVYFYEIPVSYTIPAGQHTIVWRLQGSGNGTNDTYGLLNNISTLLPPQTTPSPVTTASTTASAPTVTLNAAQTLIASGSSTTLTWSSTNATSCTASGPNFSGTIGTSGGPQSTGKITSNQTYNITCIGAGGTQTVSVTVKVFTKSPPSNLKAIYYNTGKVVLNWQSNTAGIESGFDIERADNLTTDPSAFYPLTTTNKSISTAVDDFSASTTYPTSSGESYRVRAILPDSSYTDFSNIANASNCMKLSGNGPRKIVFMRGRATDGDTDTLTANYLSSVYSIINNGFTTIDPMKSYINQFSFYVDIKNVNETPSAGFIDDPTDITKSFYDKSVNDVVKNSSSCGNDASGYFFITGVPSKDGGGGGYVSYLGPGIEYLNPTEISKATVPLWMVAIHEFGHGFAKLFDEYIKSDDEPFDYINYWVTSMPSYLYANMENCSVEPNIDFRSSIDGRFYGSTSGGSVFGDEGCTYLNTFSSGHTFYRPNTDSIMEGIAALSYKFNVISCGYMVSAILGEPVDKAHAQTHWPAVDVSGNPNVLKNSKGSPIGCMAMNTVQAGIPSFSPTPAVVSIGLDMTTSQLQLTISTSSDFYAITKYDIFGSNTAGKLGTLLATITSSRISTSSPTTYTDPGLTKGGNYCYTVVDTNTNSLSATSTQVCDDIAAPQNLTLTKVSISSIKLSWGYTATAQDGFIIEAANVSQGGSQPSGDVSWSTIKTVAKTVRSLTLTGIAKGKLHYYRVTAYNSTSKSSPSNAVYFDNTAPTVPILQPIQIGFGSVNINGVYSWAKFARILWNNSIDDFDNVGGFRAAGYNVFRYYSGSRVLAYSLGAGTENSQGEGRANGYDQAVFDDGMMAYDAERIDDPYSLKAGSTYCYTVQAFDLAGNTTVESNKQCAVVPAAPPAGVTATQQSLNRDAASTSSVSSIKVTSSNNTSGSVSSSVAIPAASSCPAGFSASSVTGSGVNCVSDTTNAAGLSSAVLVRNTPVAPLAVSAPTAPTVSNCQPTPADQSYTGTTAGSVWGSGPYTNDSTIAAAAVHQGLLKVGQMGTIHVTSVGNLASFTGSTKNGVTTYGWGSFCGVNLSLVNNAGTVTTVNTQSSFATSLNTAISLNPNINIGSAPLPPGAPAAPVIPTAPSSPAPISAPTVSNCQPTPADQSYTGTTAGSVWGSGPYTNDSTIAAAAVHQGLLKVGQMGTIHVTSVGNLASFTGSTKNGVTTYGWGSFCGVNLSLVGGVSINTSNTQYSLSNAASVLEAIKSIFGF